MLVLERDTPRMLDRALADEGGVGMGRMGRCIFVACSLVWLSATAQVRSYPAGPITLVVPLAPGDAADIAARALGDELSRILKTPVLPINRPGAGGAVGTHSV